MKKKSTMSIFNQRVPRRFYLTPFRFKPYIPRRLDTDRDGIPNWKDCQPLNPRMQHNELPTEIDGVPTIIDGVTIVDWVRQAYQLRKKGYSYARIKQTIGGHKAWFGALKSQEEIWDAAQYSTMPTGLDPLLKSTISEIYKKGYKTMESSCQGRVIGESEHTYPHIAIENNKRLVLVLKRAGFVIEHPQYGVAPGYIAMGMPEDKEYTKKELEQIWRRAYIEVKKL